MFGPNPIDEKIAEEISRLLLDMRTKKRDTKEYAAMTDQLTKLYELHHKSRFNKEQAVAIGANLLGMLLVIKAEHVGIIATKAFSLVKKIV